MNLSAVILSGGESRRMGCDKAWLKVEGQPLIARAVATVRGLGVKEIFISARSGEDYSSLRCPVLVDREPGFGPLAGIERGLGASASPLLLVLAVDLPQMTIPFLRKLVARCGASTGVVPKLKGQLEPLAGIYPKRCHSVVQDFIRKSRHAACEFAEACLRRHMVRAYAVAPREAICFANWNSPQDISSVKAVSDKGGEGGTQGYAFAS